MKLQKTLDFSPFLDEKAKIEFIKTVLPAWHMKKNGRVTANTASHEMKENFKQNDQHRGDRHLGNQPLDCVTAIIEI